MDPLSALSLASNIVQFIDFGLKLVKSAAEVSSSGTAHDVQDACVIADSLKSLMGRLRTPSIPPSAPQDDEKLVALAKNCSKICAELQELVRRVSSNKPGSKTESFRAALRSLMHKDKLRSLTKRLEAHRNQVLSQIIIYMSERQSATYALIESLVTSYATASHETRKELRKARDEIVADIRSELQSHNPSPTDSLFQARLEEEASPSSLATASLDPTPPSLPRKFGELLKIRTELDKISSTLKTINAQEQILDKLWFPEIQHRKNAIENAYQDTYRWLLHGSEFDSQHNRESEFQDEMPEKAIASISDHDQRSETEERSVDSPEPESTRLSRAWELVELEKDQKRNDFLRWLRAGSGIFYVSGKAGSGKSTLMKSLACDPRTREELQIWAQADGKVLVFAQFFFWDSGSPLQRSIEGLYRGILWEALCACPALIEEVFLDLWQAAQATVFNNGRRDRHEIDVRLLQTAFDLLIKSQKLRQQCKMCFFIDGLDEYSGDYWKLAKLLKSWCSSNDVKMCVSSRPYFEFQHIFEPQAASWLKLHELTRRDMLRFVQDEFSNDERTAEFFPTEMPNNMLVTSIIDRADGVFMWVRIVVLNLLIGMGNSCSMAQLQEKLDALPDGLTPMFHRMLDRIERSDRPRTFRTFLTMKNDALNWSPSNWVYVQAVLDDLMDEPSLEKVLLDGEVGPPLSDIECISKCRSMRRRLLGRSQGLLEVVCTDGSFPYCHQLKFVHRTVSEFLEEPTVLQEMQRAVGDFQPRKLLALGLLSLVKHLPPGKRLTCRASDNSRGRPSLQVSDFNILETYNPESMLHPLIELASLAESAGSQPFLAELESLRHMYLNLAALDPDYQLQFPVPVGGSALGWHWEEIPSADLEASMLCSAVSHAAFDLAKEKFKMNPGLLQHGRHNFLLASSMSEAFLGRNELIMTKFIFQNKALPNKHLPRRIFKYREFEIDQILSATRQVAYFPSVSWTTWTLFLMHLSITIANREVQSAVIVLILDLYLRHGADPSVCFIGYIGHRGLQQSDWGQEMLGPYYADLLTTLKLWGLAIPSAMQESWAQKVRSTNYTPWGWLRSLQRTTRHAARIPQFVPEDLNGKDFLILIVVPLHEIEKLAMLDIRDALKGYTGALGNIGLDISIAL